MIYSMKIKKILILISVILYSTKEVKGDCLILGFGCGAGFMQGSMYVKDDAPIELEKRMGIPLEVFFLIGAGLDIDFEEKLQYFCPLGMLGTLYTASFENKNFEESVFEFYMSPYAQWHIGKTDFFSFFIKGGCELTIPFYSEKHNNGFLEVKDMNFGLRVGIGTELLNDQIKEISFFIGIDLKMMMLNQTSHESNLDLSNDFMEKETTPIEFIVGKNQFTFCIYISMLIKSYY